MYGFAEILNYVMDNPDNGVKLEFFVNLQQDVSAVQYVDYQPILYYFIFNGYLIIIIFMGMFRLHVCILSKTAEIVAVMS